MSAYSNQMTSEDAFNEMYEMYRNRLYGFILTLVHSSDIAEDITQEIFIKIWIFRDELTHVEDKERYIFMMAKNKTLNYIRKAKNDIRILEHLKSSMVVGVDDVEDKVIFAEYQQLVDRALQKLSSQRRVVFRMSRYQGLKIGEIADELHLSPNTVKNHLAASLQFIKSYLVEHGVTLPLTVLLLLSTLF